MYCMILISHARFVVGKHSISSQGDPATNGRGDIVGTCDGILGVFVKGPPIKKIRRANQQIVDTNTLVDDGSLQIGGDNHMDWIYVCVFRVSIGPDCRSLHASII
jgi:hypothetical protein